MRRARLGSRGVAGIGTAAAAGCAVYAGVCWAAGAAPIGMADCAYGWVAGGTAADEAVCGYACDHAYCCGLGAAAIDCGGTGRCGMTGCCVTGCAGALGCGMGCTGAPPLV